MINKTLVLSINFSHCLKGDWVCWSPSWALYSSMQGREWSLRGANGKVFLVENCVLKMVCFCFLMCFNFYTIRWYASIAFEILARHKFFTHEWQTHIIWQNVNEHTLPFLLFRCFDNNCAFITGSVCCALGQDARTLPPQYLSILKRVKLVNSELWKKRDKMLCREEPAKKRQYIKGVK